MEGILGTIAEQLPMAVLVVILIIWLLTRQDKLDKANAERQDKLDVAQDERRAKEREFQASEANKQRLWSEDQGKKRDEFQRELLGKTQEFMEKLQKDQQKSSTLLNESIQLLAGKTDLIYQSLNQHHSFTEKSISEINKWRDGTAIRRKAGLED